MSRCARHRRASRHWPRDHAGTRKRRFRYRHHGYRRIRRTRRCPRRRHRTRRTMRGATLRSRRHRATRQPVRRNRRTSGTGDVSRQQCGRLGDVARRFARCIAGKLRPVPPGEHARHVFSDAGIRAAHRTHYRCAWGELSTFDHHHHFVECRRGLRAARRVLRVQGRSLHGNDALLATARGLRRGRLRSAAGFHRNRDDGALESAL